MDVSIPQENDRWPRVGEVLILHYINLFYIKYIWTFTKDEIRFKNKYRIFKVFVVIWPTAFRPLLT